MPEPDAVLMSHCQFIIVSGLTLGGHMEWGKFGDELVHSETEQRLMVQTGVQTGSVSVRVRGLAASPGEDAPRGWEAVSEVDLWSIPGTINVSGLMSRPPAGLEEVAMAGRGLYRIRVMARHREPGWSLIPFDERVTEEYEILAWPVDRAVGLRTLRRDHKTGHAVKDLLHAARWAMIDLVDAENAGPEYRKRLTDGQSHNPNPRVEVHRRASFDLTAPEVTARLNDLGTWLGGTASINKTVLTVGKLQLTLAIEPAAALRPDVTGLNLLWTWHATEGSEWVVPEPEPTSAQIRFTSDADCQTEVTVVHRDIQARQAIQMGMLWEYLLSRLATAGNDPSPVPHPWVALFDGRERRAAEAAARRALAAKQQFEEKWGPGPLGERLSVAGERASMMLLLDPELTEAVAGCRPDQQRAIAVWAAHRAAAVSGLDELDWVVSALHELDEGRPLTAPFDDVRQMWDRVKGTRKASTSVVSVTQISSTPARTRRDVVSLPHAAWPAIPAAGNADELAAALDALWIAGIAHGHDRPRFLAEVRRAFPDLAVDQDRKGAE